MKVIIQTEPTTLQLSVLIRQWNTRCPLTRVVYQPVILSTRALNTSSNPLKRHAVIFWPVRYPHLVLESVKAEECGRVLPVTWLLVVGFSFSVSWTSCSKPSRVELHRCGSERSELIWFIIGPSSKGCFTNSTMGCFDQWDLSRTLLFIFLPLVAMATPDVFTFNHALL